MPYSTDALVEQERQLSDMAMQGYLFIISFYYSIPCFDKFFTNRALNLFGHSNEELVNNVISKVTKSMVPVWKLVEMMKVMG